MKSQNIEMTSGPLSKNIFKYSLPLIFSNLLQVLFNIADVAVVGRFAGPMPLGSVGSTSQLLFLYTGLIIGLGGGISVIVAFYLGRKDSLLVSQSIFSSLIVSIAMGLALTGLGIASARPSLTLIKTKPELLDGAVTYFIIYMLSMPACAIYNWGSGVLSAQGDTRRPLYYLTIAGIINIILNLFFVIICKMDCAGVAWASVISESVSAILVYLAVYKRQNPFRARQKLNKNITVQILKIGIPSGMQNAIFAVANTFVQMGVNSFDAVMVAGTAASANLDNIVYNAMAAFYTADAAFIGQNYGAGNKKRVLQSFLISGAFAFATGLILGLGLIIFGRQTLAIFTTDPAVIESGMLRQRIMGFSYCIASFMDNTIAANRGLGKTFVPSLLVMAGSCIFRIVWIYTIFAWFQTIPSLFLLYIFSWAITAFAQIAYFARTFKRAF